MGRSVPKPWSSLARLLLAGVALFPSSRSGQGPGPGAGATAAQGAVPKEDPNRFGIDHRRPELYLAQGPQTQLEPADLETWAPGLLPRLRGLPAGLGQLGGLSGWLQAEFEPVPDGGRSIGTATVRDVLQNRRLAGPQDFALVFAAVARLLGCPAVVVDSFGLDWAKAGAKGPAVGRTFVEVFVEGRWVLVDPARGTYVAQGYDPGNPALPLGKGFYALAKGADTQSCGIHSNRQMQQRMVEAAGRLQGVPVELPACQVQHWPRPEKASAVTYALVTVNGQPVPSRIKHDGMVLEIRSGAFTLGPGATCTSRMNAVLPSGQETTRVTTATFSQVGTTLTMKWRQAGTTTGVLAGDSFTMTNVDMVLVYARGAAAANAEPSREVEGWPCREGPELDRKGRLKSCILAREHPLAGTTTRLPAGTRIAFSEGQPESCTLGAAASVEGFALPAGTEVHFSLRSPDPARLRPWVRSQQGRPEGATLREQAEIRELPLPAGTRIHFRCEPTREDGPGIWRCTLPERVRIQGHLCEKGGTAVGNKFYASGRLRAAELAEDELIDGVPCTSIARGLPFKTRFFGTDSKAWFHENGHLQQAMVKQDCTLEGRTFKAGDIVRLTPEGRLDKRADTTLGAFSRLESNRPPPASYRPGHAAGHPTQR